MPGAHYYMKPKKAKAPAPAAPAKPKRTFKKRASAKSRLKAKKS